jgi:hypothetical protein
VKVLLEIGLKYIWVQIKKILLKNILYYKYFNININMSKTNYGWN